jgi:hypothetical protein
MEPRISGKDATHVAIEATKRRPVRIEAPEPGTSNEVPALSDVPQKAGNERERPPRVPQALTRKR